MYTIYIMNKLPDLSKENVTLYKTTPTLIVESLREAILKGKIKGGQALRQEELANSFGVSRIPVREALRQLEAEGLITIYPNRGAIVTELSASEAQELYEMRAALETAALKAAFPELTEERLQQAEAILLKIEQEADVSRWGELNWEFHAALYAAAKRPRMFSLIQNLHLSIDRYMRLELSVMEHQAVSQQEHRQLLAACRDKDLTLALAILQNHIEDAARLLVQYLEQTDK